METLSKESRQYRGICVPFDNKEYDSIISDAASFRASLDSKIESFPALFPVEISGGYKLKDIRYSKKLGISIRRIEIDGISYTTRPSFVMPYMTGVVSEVEPALFFRKFDVPFWALAHVFGKDAMYWYRMEQSIGRNSLVGTTIKNPEDVPKDISADEKHTRLLGKKAYVATTVGDNCILGVSVTTDAGTKSLTKAYGKFKEEAQLLDPEYIPETVNTDGWQGTRNAWKTIFPCVVLIGCFLHIYIKIRDRSKKKYNDLFHAVSDKFWNCYRAQTKASFSQRVRRLYEWVKKIKNVPDVIMKPIEKLRESIELFSVAYDHPNAHRTSNMVDRLMQRLDRHLFSTQYFHGSLESAELSIQGWALINNFAPSNPITVKKYEGWQSPAERINQFRYHECWLQNLLISASLRGFQRRPPNPL